MKFYLLRLEFKGKNMKPKETIQKQKHRKKPKIAYKGHSDG